MSCDFETPEQEWDFLYNPKRISIEALEFIEIKQKGEGPIKPHINTYNASSQDPGPFYDPKDLHLHIWKKDSSIKNFTSVQDPKSTHVQYTDYKKGLYCCICHCKNKNSLFKYINTKPNKNPYTPPKIEYESNMNHCVEIKKEYTESWKQILKKVLYAADNKKILYPISNHKSLLLWPWQLTSYQKFKLKNPNYKNTDIFINQDKNYYENYASIV